MTTRLWLVRHGQIQANVDGRWHGSTDSPLTAAGQAQVAATGAWFKAQARPITAVYASPCSAPLTPPRESPRPSASQPSPNRHSGSTALAYSRTPPSLP